MNTILQWSGVVALVILAIMWVMSLGGGPSTLVGSTACSSITCLSGGLRLVSDTGGTFESDVAAVFSGGLTETSTGTTTLKILTTSTTKGICIQLNATSSLTVNNLTATTTTGSNGNQSGLVLAYGACP